MNKVKICYEGEQDKKLIDGIEKHLKQFGYALTGDASTGFNHKANTRELEFERSG